MKTFNGSCHCGAVRFEADFDPSQATLRCNCSYCIKIRCWVALVAPESFRLQAGQSDLTDYQFNSRREHQFFCKHCGVRSHGLGNSPRLGKFYGVSVTCLDIPADQLARLPITWVDGLCERWDAAPAETRHL